MALQLTETLKGVSHTNAYHDVFVTPQKDKAIITVNTFKDLAASSNPGDQLDNKEFEVDSADNTTYFLTVHATDNVNKRAEQYLIDKVAAYASATQI